MPELAKDHLPLSMHDENNWLALAIVMYPVLKLVDVLVQVQAQGLPTLVDVLCDCDLPDLQHVVSVGI